MPSLPTQFRVTRLWRYPVKSLGGEAVDTLAIDARGGVGDRRFAIQTQAGKIGSGKHTRRFERVDGLLQLASTMGDDGVPVVVLPDGTTVHGDDPHVHDRLSQILGQPVTLAVEHETSHFDDAALHLISQASIDWLAARTPDVQTDERRLRPNVVIDLGTSPHAEQAWIGQELILGTARVRIREATQRCVMVGMTQRGLPAAPTALRRIVQDNAACLGVYAEVVQPGIVTVGQTVQPLDEMA